MRIGCCTKLEQLEAVACAGFDFAELQVVDLLPDQEDSAYAPIRRRIQHAGTPIEAFNVFIPKHRPVVGPRRDLLALKGYLTTALGRMAELGARLVVFGSGPARMTPPGFEHHLVPDQILEFLGLASEVATPHAIDSVIEPLWRERYDNINTVLEATVVAPQSGSPCAAHARRLVAHGAGE